MERALRLDNPWHRLPWTLPVAIVIWIFVLWEFGQILQKPPAKTVESVPIEAELIEIPPPAQEPVIQPEPPKPVHKPAPAPKPAERPSPSRQRDAPVTQPVTSSQLPVEPATAEAVAQSAPPLVPTPGPATGTSQSAGTTNMGARAIVRPLPQIPDELREDAFNAVAVARFQIAADGSATFGLIGPTPNARLNRLLLDKLKEWRFFPAMREGKAVASTQDVRINLEVK